MTDQICNFQKGKKCGKKQPERKRDVFYFLDCDGEDCIDIKILRLLEAMK